MESVASRVAVLSPSRLRGVDGNALAIWLLALPLVLYLGFDGGGYDLIVSSQVGIVVWWAVLMFAAWGVIPRRRPARLGWACLGLFAAFTAWTALGATWSLSSERSLQDLARVACYLGVLVLAIAVHRDRETGLRHTTAAIGTAIAVLAAFAVVSRLIPGSFPASHVTAAFLASSQRRLGWPLNYWNGLAALIALGIPLLLSLATSARSLLGRALAGAGLPLLALCGYLTFSRGGAIEVGVALVVFLLFAPERLAKVMTILLGAGGAGILIIGAHRRGAIENGLVNHAAAVQGHSLLIATVITCAGVGIAQAGLGLLGRHLTLPRLLRVSPARTRILFGAGVALLLMAGLAVNGPHRLSHAWYDFKTNQGAAGGGQNVSARYGSLSGENRYSYWSVAMTQSAKDRLHGTGPGTFQLLWDPHAPVYSPVINAHSLYVETLAETGLVGSTLLELLFLLIVIAGVRATMTPDPTTRTRAAAVLAALLAFMVGASVDWLWQLPVLPVVFMLLAASVLVPGRGPSLVRRRLAGRGEGAPAVSRPQRAARALGRGGVIVLAALALIATAVPLAAESDVRSSQNAAAASDLTAAAGDARSAIRIEPGASSPYLQLALVLELRHDLPPAVVAARHAVRDESRNWANWLILSRLEAEDGHPGASLRDYRRARSLNPRSPLFGLT